MPEPTPTPGPRVSDGCLAEFRLRAEEGWLPCRSETLALCDDLSDARAEAANCRAEWQRKFEQVDQLCTEMARIQGELDIARAEATAAEGKVTT